MFLKQLFSLLGDNDLGRGLEAMKAGRLREAIRTFLPHLEDPDAGTRERARLYCCEAYLQLGDEIRSSDPAAALKCYHEAHELQPGFADVAHRCGEMQRHLGEPAAAQESFGRALAINPAFLDARLASLSLYLEVGDETEAATQIAALSANSPSLFEREIEELERLFSDGEFELVRAKVEALRRREPSPLEVQREAARTAMAEGDAPRAVRILRELVVDHRYPDLLHFLGLAESEAGDHARAEAAFRAALEIHPGYQKARINLALSLLDQSRPEEAEEQLEAVLEINPEHPLALGALEEIRAVREVHP